jgi:hypothetical protein
MRQQPYINVSGAVLNSNKTDSFFQVNAAQYTSYYKSNRTLSILPVQAYFNSNKYKTKKPIPSNNMYVSVEGFLEDIETDSSGLATRFHVSIDNISFLGRAAFSPSPASSLGKHLRSFSASVTTFSVTAPSTPSRFSRFKFNFESSSSGSLHDASSPSMPSNSVTPVSPVGTATRAGKRKK